MEGKKRLTLKCIEKYDPSPGAPLVVSAIYPDKVYLNHTTLCIISKPMNGGVPAIDAHNDYLILYEDSLKNYPSPFQDQIVTLYECFGSATDEVKWVNSEGRVFIFPGLDFSTLQDDSSFKERFTGRSLKVDISTGKVFPNKKEGSDAGDN